MAAASSRASEMATPHIANPVKEDIAAGRLAYAFTIKLCRPIEVVYMAKAAGYNSVLVDLEHSPLSIEQAGQLCIAALGAEMTPIVRVPSVDRQWISRSLDAGALGIIVPHMKTVADVRKVVQCARFQPLGERSAIAGLSHLKYRPYPVTQANKACNDATMVIIMIETTEALENIDDIAAEPGIDQLLIGTNDLTAELGIPGQYDDPLLHDAYCRVIAAAKRHGLSVGIGGLNSRPDLIEKYCNMGARFVMAAADQVILQAAIIQSGRELAVMADRIAARNV